MPGIWRRIGNTYDLELVDCSQIDTTKLKKDIEELINWKKRAKDEKLMELLRDIINQIDIKENVVRGNVVFTLENQKKLLRWVKTGEDYENKKPTGAYKNTFGKTKAIAIWRNLFSINLPAWWLYVSSFDFSEGIFEGYEIQKREEKRGKVRIFSDDKWNEWYKTISSGTDDAPKIDYADIVDDEEEEEPIDNRELELLTEIYDRITQRGFIINKETFFNFYISLKAKPFVILCGISGTGKTKLTKIFADAIFDVNRKEENPYYKIVPVRPDWNDDKYLLGFYNPLTNEYMGTSFLDFLIAAIDHPDEPYFLCLDEMNLARVEYYFSNFLSAMETDDKTIELYSKRNKPKNNDIYRPTIQIPPNLFFLGTVNVDETTFQFSPKVLDRANTIEFTEVELSKRGSPVNEDENEPFPTEEFMKFILNDEEDAENILEEWKDDNGDIIEDYISPINNILERSGLHFGYRTRDEILRYIFFSEGLLDFTIAFDFQIRQKILPKIKGGDDIRDTLEALKKFLSENEFTRSSKKLERMLERLKNEGWTGYF